MSSFECRGEDCPIYIDCVQRGDTPEGVKYVCETQAEASTQADFGLQLGCGIAEISPIPTGIAEDIAKVLHAT